MSSGTPDAVRNNINVSSQINQLEGPNLLVALVGLPCRGKTFVSEKLSRYLNWIDFKSRVFHLSDYRRLLNDDIPGNRLFMPGHPEWEEQRKHCLDTLFSDIWNWFEGEFDHIAIMDASNCTLDRRQYIKDACSEHKTNLLFIEVITNDPKLIKASLQNVELNHPDYVSMSREEAIRDFNERIKAYEKSYEPMTPEKDDCPYIKFVDAGRQVFLHHVHGHLFTKIAAYLVNIHSTNRCIYLTRHGESEDNIKHRIGGNSKLSSYGKHYAHALGEYINSEDIPDLQVWTSKLHRTIQTAAHIEAPTISWQALNELNAGEFDCFAYSELRSNHKDEYKARQENKFFYRYPKGESYADLVVRLDPVIMELERSSNVLVICHQGVIRCLLAYFLGKSTKELPFIDTPLHVLYKLTPKSYGCDLELIKFDNIPICRFLSDNSLSDVFEDQNES